MKIKSAKCPRCGLDVRIPVVELPNNIMYSKPFVNIDELEEVGNINNYFYKKIKLREKLYLQTILKFPNLPNEKDGEVIEVLIWDEKNNYYWVKGEYGKVYKENELLDMLSGIQKYKTVDMYMYLIDIIK